MSGTIDLQVIKADCSINDLHGWFIGTALSTKNNYSDRIEQVLNFINKYDLNYCKGIILSGSVVPYSYTEGHASISSVDNVDLAIVFCKELPVYKDHSELVSFINSSIENDADLFLIDETLYNLHKAKSKAPATVSAGTSQSAHLTDRKTPILDPAKIKGVPLNNRRRFGNAKPTFWKKH